MTTPSRRALEDVTLFPFWLDNPEAPSVEPQLIGRNLIDLVTLLRQDMRDEEKRLLGV